MTFVTSVLINGVECKTKILDWKVTPTHLQEITLSEIKALPGIESLVTLSNGLTLELWRGTGTADYRWFKGTVTKFKKEGAIFKITGKNDLAQLQNRLVTKSYDYLIDPQAGVLSEIAKDLVVTYGGLVADATTVQNSGTTVIITRFVCKHAYVNERVKRIIAPLNWQLYFDDHIAKVYIEPKGFVDSGITLTVATGGDITKVPKWTHDSARVVNVLELIGAEDIVETTEFFSGDTVEDTFELAYATTSIKVFVGGTLQVGGKPDSTETFDYEVDNDFENPSGSIVSRIIFQSGSIPPTGTSNIEVRYSYAVPVPVKVTDATSIATYGERAKSIFLMDAKSVNDALEYAHGYISKWKDEFVSTVVEIGDASGLKAGMKVTINDTINGENNLVVINKMEIVWPGPQDKLHVGDEEWRLADFLLTEAEKLRRTQEEQSNNLDILFQEQVLTRDPVTVTRTLTKQTQKNYNTMLYGIGPYGTGYTYSNQADFDKGTMTGIDTTNNDIRLSAAPGSGDWTSDTFTFSPAWGFKIDCFRDGSVSDWTITGPNLTAAIDTTGQLEGNNSMKLTAAASSDGTYIEKALSDEDASDYRYLHVYCEADSTAADLLEVSVKNNGSWTLVGTITLAAINTPEDFTFDLSAITHNDLEGVRITSNSNSTYVAYVDRIVITDAASVTSTFKQLTWTETTPGTSTVTCDVLNARDDSVLIAGATSPQDLSAVADDIPIKIKFSLSSPDANNPTVDDVLVSWQPGVYGDQRGEEVTVT